MRTAIELGELLDDICATIGELLVTNAQLKESMVDDAATDAAKEKLDRLKRDTLAAKGKLADIKQRQQHKKELERQRKERERQSARTAANEGKSTRSRVALLDATGRWIGFVETLANNSVNIYDSRGRIVARELGGLTLDQNGKLFAKGRAGLVALGKKLAA